MYKVLLGGYTSRYRMETRTLATNAIVDKGRGTAVGLSHENNFIMEVEMDTVTQRKFEVLEMVIDKQSKELTRLSNAIERISIAMTAVRMNESKGKKR